MFGTMSFLAGPILGFIIPNLFLWGPPTRVLGTFKTYLGWILTIEFGIAVVCTVPNMIFFKNRPDHYPGRVAKMRRLSFKKSAEYLWKKKEFFLLLISFACSSAIFFQLV